MRELELADGSEEGAERMVGAKGLEPLTYSL